MVQMHTVSVANAFAYPDSLAIPQIVEENAKQTRNVHRIKFVLNSDAETLVMATVD